VTASREWLGRVPGNRVKEEYPTCTLKLTGGLAKCEIAAFLGEDKAVEVALLIARDLSVGNRRPGASRFYATRKNVAFLVVGRANI